MTTYEEPDDEIVVQHIIEKHPDIVTFHLLYHKIVLPQCRSCYEAHLLAMEKERAPSN